MATRTEKAKNNIVWSGFYKCTSLLMPFITRTVVIYVLGMQYVGLGSLFTSLLSVLSFAELGIGGALVFSMYEPMAKNDEEKVCALLNFYRKCYLVIGTIIFIVGLILLPFLNYFIAGDTPQGINIYILFAIHLVNNVLGYFLFAYKSSLLTASQRVDLTSKIGMITNFIANVLQIVLLLLFHNYYIFILVLPMITIVDNICTHIIAKKLYPQYTCRGKISRKETKGIQEKVAGMLCQKIGGIVLSSVDTIVISSFLGLRILGIYNGYYYIVTTLFGFLGVIQQSIIPVVGNSVVTETVEKNHTDFRKFQFLYTWIISWWSACLVCMYQPFIKLWVGKGNMLPFVLVILLTIYFYTYKMGDMTFIYKEALGLWWQGKFVPLIAAVVNLSFNLVMVRFIGLAGIVLSTVISVVFIYNPYGSWVLFHHYFKSMRGWIAYLKSMVGYAAIAVVVTIITWYVCHFIEGYALTTLILRGLICLVLPNILLFLIYWRNKNFKNAFAFVKNMIKKS